MHSLECHYFLAVMHGNFHDCMYILSVEEWTVRTMNTNDGQYRITFFDIELQKNATIAKYIARSIPPTRTQYLLQVPNTPKGKCQRHVINKNVSVTPTKNITSNDNRGSGNTGEPEASGMYR